MKQSTKYLKITINIVSVVIIFLFCFLLLPKLMVFFMPFVIAAVIAMIANPVVRFLERKVKIVRKAGTAFVMIVVIALIVFLGYLVIARITEEIVSLAYDAPKLWASTEQTLKSLTGVYNSYLNLMPEGVHKWFDDITVSAGKDLGEWSSGLGTSAAHMTSSIAQNIPLLLISVIMTILASYFFLAEREYVVRLMGRVLPKSFIRRWYVVYGMMKDAVGGYFKAQFKIMAIVYVVLIAGLLILGCENALLLALLIAFLDFLPFFGTGTVMIPWALIKLLQSDYRMAAGLLITWGASQLIRQLVQPKFVSDSIGLAPIPTLLLLYLGFRLGGPAGLILAVPLGMIVINLYRAGVFSNFIYSIQLVFADISRLRRFSDEELESEGIKPHDTSEHKGSGNKDTEHKGPDHKGPEHKGFWHKGRKDSTRNG
ncbi:MAG: sporulation integral membrane protein YtvI [Lachnospiraceae bacterium]|nr:sporulation integral membrane protein YtvI [Lachnospiraceae bacterium]